jgi:hypothetical protein
MAAVKIFQTLRERVLKQNGMLPSEKRAMFWFHDYATELTKWQHQFRGLDYSRVQQHEFTKQLVGADKAEPGFFYFYVYDPKWKVELPYYDKFPFVLCLDSQPGRFRGLNFHYLSYFERARLFDLLYPFREGRVSHHIAKNTIDPHGIRDIRMRLKVTYALLSVSTRYDAFKPCLKSYLVDHVQTPLMKVGAAEWDIALFLPVESFEKQTKNQVWDASRKMF